MNSEIVSARAVELLIDIQCQSLRDECLDGIVIIMESGYSKPTALIKMPDRDGLVGVLTKNYTILRSKAEFDQLKEQALQL